MSEQPVGDAPSDDEVVRHEEELRIEPREREAGAVRVRTNVDSGTVTELVDRDVEDGVIDRRPALEDDSGEVEVLEDGSVSIPLLEEELVVTKRLVVRERIIVRKERHSEPERIEAELRRERVEAITEGPDEPRRHS